MKTIDLNCDLGEGMQTDEQIIPLITSANIACSFHAGDMDTMKQTIGLCLQYNIAIGAHPSWPDKENFGRKEMQIQTDISILQRIAGDKRKKTENYISLINFYFLTGQIN